MLKQYLGSKKTRGDILTTWLNIEATIVNQISRIRTEANSERNCTPLYVDRKAFCGVFSIVTWHVC